MAEARQSLQQLGMRACPVCGSAESLGMSPFPVLLVDGKFPPDAGDLHAFSPTSNGAPAYQTVRDRSAGCTLET